MELDIVRGLELGGDDYITKPFSLMILRARVNSVLRRRGDKQTAEQSALFRSGGLNLDFYNMNFSRIRTTGHPQQDGTKIAQAAGGQPGTGFIQRTAFGSGDVFSRWTTMR